MSKRVSKGKTKALPGDAELSPAGRRPSTNWKSFATCWRPASPSRTIFAWMSSRPTPAFSELLAALCARARAAWALLGRGLAAHRN